MPISIAMIYTRARWEEKAILKEIEKRGLPVTPIKLTERFFDLANLGVEHDVYLQRTISYFAGLYSTAVLEAAGATVVNSYEVSAICGNKLLTTLKLIQHGVPTPRTAVAFSVEAALRAVESLGYPSILKPIFGSWGRLVAPLNDPQSARAIFEDRAAMHPLYQIYYVQERVKRPPRDIRAFVIGDEVPAAIFRVSRGEEWRTNTSLGGKAIPCPVTDELRELCLRAAEAVGGGVLGVDIMEDEEKGLVVHEVNHVVEFRNTVPVTGVNIPAYIVDYLVEVAKR